MSWRVYLLYFRRMGISWVILSIVTHVLSVGFSSFNKTWLSVWADDKLSDYITTEANIVERRDIYLGVYGGLGLAVILTYILGGLSVSFF